MKIFILLLSFIIPVVVVSQKHVNSCGCPSNVENVGYVYGDTLCIADCPVGREILKVWLQDTAYAQCPFTVGNTTYGVCWKTTCKKAGRPTMLLMVDDIFLRDKKDPAIIAKEPFAEKTSVSTAQQ